MRRTWLVVGALLLAGCARTHTDGPLLAQTPSAAPSRTASPMPTPRASATASPRPRPSASASAQVSSYRWSSRRVTAAELGATWHPGCPVGPASLRVLSLPYRDFSGARHVGELVVHRALVARVAAVFEELYAEGFPIRSMRPVSEFGGSDDRSMAADNTSGFNCRDAVGGSGWSQHAYGRAIDVNPVENPYVLNGKALPPAGAAYRDRSRHRPGMAYRGSAVTTAFARQGFLWGGRWKSPDYQHFSTSGE